MFVDTSFLVALLDEDDARYAEAAWVCGGRPRVAAPHPCSPATTWSSRHARCCSDAWASPAVRRLDASDLLDPVTVEWVTRADHERALSSALRVAGRRDLSLVDCVSFEVMRRLDVARVPRLRQHFDRAGVLADLGGSRPVGGHGGPPVGGVEYPRHSRPAVRTPVSNLSAWPARRAPKGRPRAGDEVEVHRKTRRMPPGPARSLSSRQNPPATAEQSDSKVPSAACPSAP